MFDALKSLGSAIARRIPEGFAGRTLTLAAVLATAILAGMQFLSPDARVLQLIAGGFIVLLAFRFRSIEGLMLAVLFLPFPKGTSYGTTNVAFILLIFIVWLFRVSTRRAEPPGRTPLDVPIIGLVMAYCVSFYNVQPQYLTLAWGLFMSFLTYLLIFFMVIAIVRTTDGRAEAVPRADDLVRPHVPVRALRAAPPGHDADPGVDLLRRHPGRTRQRRARRQHLPRLRAVRRVLRAQPVPADVPVHPGDDAVAAATSSSGSWG